ncbi:helix-turn-helix transcriptional regulator [Pseudonocardia sp. RS010]|uniref:helix-turn-helix transcriptional regulator n=1 Tax=Pseudonocardia sp. RS010 TaxID=3385979 RepID=UPI00399FCF8A
MTGGGALVEARAAFGRRAWAEAYARFVDARARVPLAPRDLEQLATAAYLTGHDEESTDAWAGAHRARLDGGQTEQAVRCAFWLGLGLLLRGELAPGSGWTARARSLVDQHRLDGVEVGYLLVPDGLMALAGGDRPAARDLFERAHTPGRRFGDADLSALGCVGLGQVLLRQGRTVEGLGRFDEAMVAVTLGELSPTVAGLVYCAVIDECQQAFDVRRAVEWTAALGRWCDAQPGLVPYRGQCLVHRSQVLQLRGAWRTALDEARQARDRLARPPHPALGMAHYQLGELHRLRGEAAEAQVAYRLADRCGRRPQPGLALLHLSRGRVDAAAGAVERALADARDHLSRVGMLPATVEIMLAAGRVDAARAAVEELADVAVAAGSSFLLAAAAHGRGALLLAERRPAAALEALREAWRCWQELRVPYEAAQTLVLVAVACRAVGDHEGAEQELSAARRALEGLGAAPALARLAELAGTVGGAGGRGGRPLAITPRELEVLRLVAAGQTNRTIADTLVISEKTVERHLSNIFTRLGVPNRAAATAYAYAHDLV